MTRTSMGWLAGGVLMLVGLLIANLIFGIQNVRQLEENFQRTIDTQSVISELEAILSEAKDAETGQRGYIITGESSYLEPYRSATGTLNKRVDHLQHRLGDDPGQQAKLTELRRRLNNRLQILAEVMALRDQSGLEAARQSMLSGRGKQEMDALRAVVAEMAQREREILRDRSESSARSYQAAVMTALIGGLAAIGSIAGFLFLLRRYLTSRTRDAEVVAQQAERLRTTLASIGDGVITTDADGNITNMNVVAESLTGWTNEDAVGQELNRVFRIVNEDTREEVENPARKALREGVIIGLGNHTVLVSKDGTERPIDDSAAPIRTESGDVTGCVLVFRDVSERRQEAAATAERGRLVALRTDVSGALGSGESLESVLQSVCEAFVHHLDMAFARIWVLNVNEEILELKASGGIYTHLDGAHGRVKVGQLKIGRIAASREPHLTNSVVDDPNVSDREWARREGMTGFAGYPLMVADRVIGVAAMFSRKPISEAVLTDLAPLCGAIASFVDRRMADRVLSESEARKSAMFENALDSIISIDHQGRIIEINAAAEQTFGYSREEVLGRELAELIIPPEYRGQHREGLKKFIATGEGPILNKRLELSALRSNGNEFPVELTVTRIAVEGAPQFTAYLRDITERKALEKMQAEATNELRQLAADLSEANRRKTEFLAMLAHELRNPLAPIRNALEVIRARGSDRTELQSVSDMMDRQVGQLVRLVDDLLDVSRITRGTIELRREQVDLSKVVQHAVEVARPSCESGGVELSTTLPPEPIYLDGDPARLTQVVGNLLSNSCKFTNKGGRIDLTVEADPENAIIRVKDTGIGIARSQLPYVFEMFVQVDTSLERSTSGLGIGLSLVKNLVELHGGSVEALSDGPGNGSEFVVRLPRLPLPVSDEPAAKPDGIQRARSPRRMLVVDDNVDSAESLAMLMKIVGHNVHTAHDGLEAISAAAEFKPEVVLLDIGLPKLNGYEVARRIRELPDGQEVTLIALTGWGQEEDRRRSREAGFNAHLVKPVDHVKLIDLVDSLERSS